MRKKLITFFGGPMVLKTCLSLILFILTVCITTPAASFTPTQNDLAWLDKHPEITIGMLSDYPPQSSISEDGSLEGIDPMIFKLLDEMLPGRFKVVSDSWSNLYEAAIEKRIDVLMNLTPSKSRAAYFRYTRPYMSVPHAILARKKGPYFSSISDLNTHRVALKRNSFMVSFLRKNYPKISVIEYDDIVKTLRAVQHGKADAFIGNQMVVDYILRVNNIDDLHFHSITHETSETNVLGIRRDWPELADLLNRALTSIPREKYQAIMNHWEDESTRSNIFPEISLSEEEIVWIQSHPQIIVGAEKDWPPYDYVHNGKAVGFSNDFIRLLGKKAGLNLKFIHDYTWDELLDLAKNRKIDLLPGLIQSEKRRSYVTFTKLPILKNTYTLVVNRSVSDIQSLEDMEGRRLAVVKGYAISDVVEEEFPGIEKIFVNSPIEALVEVNEGRADGFVDFLGIINYQRRLHFLSNLQIVNLNVLPSHNTNLYTGVRKDWPLLTQILDKAMAAVTAKEVEVLKNRWLTFEEKKTDPSINLNQEETDWIKNHPIIRVGAEMDYPPYDYVLNGKAVGFANDHIRLLAEKAGLKIQFIHGYTWNQLLEKTKRREIDILPGLVKTEERESFINFTSPYQTNTASLAVHQNTKEIQSLHDLAGKKLARIKGYSANKTIIKNYPEIDILYVSSPLDALVAVSEGRADGYLDYLGVINYLRREHLIQNLRIANTNALPEVNSEDHIGVRIDWPILNQILEKAMDATTQDEYEKLKNRWFDSRTIEAASFTLTEAEKEWIDGLGILKVSAPTHLAPFYPIKSGTLDQGLYYDYLSIFSESLGLKIELVPGAWDQLLDRSQQGEIDIVPLINDTPKRRDFLAFTKPFLQVRYIIATKNEAPYYPGIDDLAGLKVGVGLRHHVADKVKKDYPEIELINFQDIEEALLALDSGEIQALLINNTIFSYNASRLGLKSSLIANNTTEYEDILAIGVKKELSPLVPILDRVISTISEKEHDLIMDKWTNLPIQHRTNWTVVWQVVGVCTLIVLIISFWSWRLRGEIRKREMSEQQLKKSNDLMNRAQSLGHVGHWEYDPMNDIIYGSDEYLRIFGTTAKEHRTIADFLSSVHPEDIEHVKQKVDSAFFNKEPYITDYRIVLPDDSVKYIHVQAEMKYDHNNKPIHMLGSLIDVTESKIAQKEVADSENRLQLALDGANAGLLYFDLENNSITWDDRSLQIFGLTREQFAGTFEAWKQCVYPEDLNNALEQYDAIISNPDLSSGAMDFRIQRPDGEIRTISTSMSILRDQNQEVKEISGLHFDITDRTKARNALQKRLDAEKTISMISSRFITMDDTQKDVGINQALLEIGELFEVDRSYLFVYNDDLTQMTNTHEWCAEGITPQMETIQNLPVNTVGWWETAKKSKSVIAVNSTSELPDEAQREKEIFMSQGIQSLLIAQLRVGGQLVGFLGLDSVQHQRIWQEEESSELSVFADIISYAMNRWKNEEKVRGLVKNKETLIQEINHRVKNNLAALIGIVHLEQDKLKTVDTSLNNILADIQNRLESLSVVHQLLSNQGWSDLRLCDIAKEVIQGVLSANALYPNIDLSIKDSDITVESATAHHLALVFNELTTNTIKYAVKHSGADRISIKLDTDENEITIEYSDNGEGFPAKIIEGNQQDDSIGFELIKGIIQFTLNGKIEIFNNNGAYTKISLPRH